jgi:hypothetical protein
MRPAGSTSISGGFARGPHPGRAVGHIAHPRSDGRAPVLTQLLDLAIVGSVTLSVVCIFSISTTMLTHWGVHYLSSGGNFYEKIHPATYLAVLAFGLMLIRHADPIAEIVRTFSGARLVLVYLFCWLCLLIQMVTLGRPFTVIIDTFMLPLLLVLVIWKLTPRQKLPVVLALHAAILINIVIGFYETRSGNRLFPLTVGDVVVLGEWRASALLGHPLTASGVVAAYVLALIFQPSICPPAVVRLPLMAFALASLMAFGGRTALVTVLLLGTIAACLQFLRLLQGARVSLLTVVAVIGLVFVAAAAIFAAFDLGFFDKMLLRFSSDKGSASARLATFNLLSKFDWQELLLGPNPVRATALQNQSGLKYGVENFWVSCIVQFGIIHTVLLTLGLGALLVEVRKRSSAAAWAIFVLMLAIAGSSVSFSSKNIQLAQFIVMIALLLPPVRLATRTIDAPVRPRPIRLVPEEAV